MQDETELDLAEIDAKDMQVVIVRHLMSNMTDIQQANDNDSWMDIDEHRSAIW